MSRARSSLLRAPIMPVETLSPSDTASAAAADGMQFAFREALPRVMGVTEQHAAGAVVHQHYRSALTRGITLSLLFSCRHGFPSSVHNPARSLQGVGSSFESVCPPAAWRRHRQPRRDPFCSSTNCSKVMEAVWIGRADGRVALQPQLLRRLRSATGRRLHQAACFNRHVFTARCLFRSRHRGGALQMTWSRPTLRRTDAQDAACCGARSREQMTSCSVSNGLSASCWASA